MIASTLEDFSLSADGSRDHAGADEEARRDRGRPRGEPASSLVLRGPPPAGGTTRTGAVTGDGRPRFQACSKSASAAARLPPSTSSATAATATGRFAPRSRRASTSCVSTSGRGRGSATGARPAASRPRLRNPACARREPRGAARVVESRDPRQHDRDEHRPPRDPVAPRPRGREAGEPAAIACAHVFSLPRSRAAITMPRSIAAWRSPVIAPRARRSSRSSMPGRRRGRRA